MKTKTSFEENDLEQEYVRWHIRVFIIGNITKPVTLREDLGHLIGYHWKGSGLGDMINGKASASWEAEEPLPDYFADEIHRIAHETVENCEVFVESQKIETKISIQQIWHVKEEKA